MCLFPFLSFFPCVQYLDGLPSRRVPLTYASKQDGKDVRNKVVDIPDTVHPGYGEISAGSFDRILAYMESQVRTWRRKGREGKGREGNWMANTTQEPNTGSCCCVNIPHV